MSTTKNVNILELAKGAIAEQIDIEVAKAMANIVDPNTDAKTARKLTVTITLKPDENRETISISAQAKAALAPIKPISTTLMVGIDRDVMSRHTGLTNKKGSGQGWNPGRSDK